MLNRKRLSQQVLEFYETKKKPLYEKCARLKTALSSPPELTAHMSKQVLNYRIHGLVLNSECDTSSRRENIISGNTMDSNLAPLDVTAPASVLVLHAAVRV